MPEQVAIVHDGTRMVFATPNDVTLIRVKSIYQKEPCTLEWIAGFSADDVLVDVGANVGMYTVWAAATRKVKVFAFEPESQNYALLNRNIMANRLDRVRGYCLGLSDTQGLTDLYMYDMRAGGSNHSVEPGKFSYRQGCVVNTLDALVQSQAIPLPDHVKIDVDGIEHKVVMGAKEVLKNVRSLLVEVNTNLDEHRDMVHGLTGLGFKYDPAQVDNAMRKDGIFKGVAEHVFTR